MVHKRSSKPQDEVQAAYDVLQRIIEKTEGDQNAAERPKNPAAVALGRLGGLKGGKARAKALSAKRRREIAKKAIAARWKKKRG